MRSRALEDTDVPEFSKASEDAKDSHWEQLENIFSYTVKWGNLENGVNLRARVALLIIIIFFTWHLKNAYLETM